MPSISPPLLASAGCFFNVSAVQIDVVGRSADDPSLWECQERGGSGRRWLCRLNWPGAGEGGPVPASIGCVVQRGELVCA